MEEGIITMKEYYTTHMIRMEDLNHHMVLYAGRAADWVIESSFVAAVAARGDSKGLLFLKMENFEFFKSILPGDIIKFVAKVTSAGRTSLTVNVVGVSEVGGTEHLSADIKFVSVDPETKKPVPHGIQV